MKNALNTGSTIAKGNYTPAKIVNMFITLFLMFGFGFLPPIGSITPVGMKVLGVTLGVVYGYTACNIIWVSLFAMIAYGISGYTPMGSALTSMFGNSTVFQSFVANLSAGAMSYYGFGKWFVRWSLNLKIFKGRPLFYVWSFFTFFGLSAFFIHQIPLLFLLFAIWSDIADNCGYKKGSSFVYVGYAGIVLSTTLGSSLIPYQGWSLGLANNWYELTGGYLNLGYMMVMTIIIAVLTITAYMFASKAIFKVDYSKLKAFDVNKMDEESKVLRPRSKRIFILYTITTALVVTGSLLVETPYGQFINQTITVSGLFALCAALLLIIPSGEGDGQACIVFNDVKNTAISWPTMLMCAVVIPLASAVTNEATGVLPMITGLLSPIFAGRGSFFLLMFTIIVALALTNVGSNIAFGGALIPIIGPFAMQEGMNPAIIGMALLFVIKVGLILPGASAPASIFHSQEAIPDAKMRMLTTGFGCLVLAVVCIVVFGISAPLVG